MDVNHITQTKVFVRMALFLLLMETYKNVALKKHRISVLQQPSVTLLAMRPKEIATRHLHIGVAREVPLQQAALRQQALQVVVFRTTQQTIVPKQVMYPLSQIHVALNQHLTIAALNVTKHVMLL